MLWVATRPIAAEVIDFTSIRDDNPVLDQRKAMRHDFLFAVPNAYVAVRVLGIRQYPTSLNATEER